MPALAYYEPWCFQEFDAPRFQDNGAHECRKVNPTFCPSLPPWNIPDTDFCQRLCRTQRHNATGRIKTMTNSNDSIEPATYRLVAQCLGQLPHRHCLLSSLKKTVWYSAVTKCCDEVNIRGQTACRLNRLNDRVSVTNRTIFCEMCAREWEQCVKRCDF